MNRYTHDSVHVKLSFFFKWPNFKPFWYGPYIIYVFASTLTFVGLVLVMLPLHVLDQIVHHFLHLNDIDEVTAFTHCK